jgi:hypothetical protein
MDKFSKEENTVLICRVWFESDGGLNVDYYPFSTKHIAMMMLMNWRDYLMTGEGGRLHITARCKVMHGPIEVKAGRFTRL